MTLLQTEFIPSFFIIIPWSGGRLGEEILHIVPIKDIAPFNPFTSFLPQRSHHTFLEGPESIALAARTKIHWITAPQVGRPRVSPGVGRRTSVY